MGSETKPLSRQEKVMKEYKEAYFAANNRHVQIDYFRGWYSVLVIASQAKYREHEIVNMTNSLRSRILQSSDG